MQYAHFGHVGVVYWPYVLMQMGYILKSVWDLLCFCAAQLHTYKMVWELWALPDFAVMYNYVTCDLDHFLSHIICSTSAMLHYCISNWQLVLLSQQLRSKIKVLFPSLCSLIINFHKYQSYLFTYTTPYQLPFFFFNSFLVVITIFRIPKAES